MPVSYADPAVAYAAALAFMFVLVELWPPETWPWYEERAWWLGSVAYLLPLIPALSVARLAAWVPLAVALAALRLLARSRSFRTLAHRERSLGVLMRLAVTALQVLAVGVFIYLTAGAGSGPLFPNPVVGTLGPAARLIVWATAYLFMLTGGTTLVRWVLDAALPELENALAWATARAATGVAGSSPRYSAPGPPRRRPGDRTPEGEAEAGEAAAASDQAGEVAAACDQAGEVAAAAGETSGAADRAAASSAGLRLGRIIGDLERVIVLTLVTQGQYAAIGFVVAAKSIARYDRAAHSAEFSDYYLVGTLMSIAVALGGGLLVNVLDRLLMG